jgi:hypothetical protein
MGRQNNKKLVEISRLSFWIFAWLLLQPAQSAFACSLREIPVSCRVEPDLTSQEAVCLNKNCSLKIEKNSAGRTNLFHLTVEDPQPSGGSLIGHVEPDGIYLSPYSPYKLPADIVNTICSEKLESHPSVQSLYQEWNIKDKKAYYGFVIEPYSVTEAQTLQALHEEILSCTDIKFVEDNGFLASFGFARSYCGPSTPIYPCGPVTVISPIKFALFAFTHPDSSTFPYILGISALLLLLIISAVVLHRRGDLVNFIRPSRFHMWGLALGVPLLCVISSIRLPYISYQLVAFYLILSTIRYLWPKEMAAK